MSTVQIEVSRNALRAIVQFSAVNDVRYYLNGACLEIGPLESRLIATDGHILGVIRIPTQSDIPAPQQFIIPLAELKAIKKAKRGESETVTVTCALEPFQGKQMCTFEYDGSVKQFPLIDGKFPDYRRMMTKEKQKEFGTVAQFNPSLLKRAQDAAEILTGADVDCIRVSHAGQNGALFHAGDPDNFSGAVMPYRADDAITAAPAWIHAELAETETARETAEV